MSHQLTSKQENAGLLRTASTNIGGKPAVGIIMLTISVCLTLCIAPASVSADWRDEIGYTKLANEIGPTLANGSGVAVGMAEAPEGANYAPNTSNPQFNGKTFTFGSGSSGTSSHANNVASVFFGNTGSIAPGVTDVTVYEANDWLDRVIGFSSGADPAIQPFRVMNHSWIGTDSVSASIDMLQRVDHIVNRDDVLIVAGTDNGADKPIPHLLASGFNSLIVGRTDGNHAFGPTTINGAGRYTPHIVGPADRTSTATPVVSSTAAMLHQVAAGTDAARSEVMRSVLMAGATKVQFSDWERTTTRPIDDRYGAGQVNVYNSYSILQGGQFDASTAEPSFSVGLSGWDYVGTVSPADTLYYNFEVANGMVMDQLSIMLNWNLEVTDLNASADIFDPSTSLANLDLRFYESNGGFKTTLLDSSLSTIDNFEHLYLTNLAAGTYTLEVTSASGSADYGLAWHGSLTAIPEPGQWFALILSAAAIASRHRFRSSSDNIAKIE